MLADYASIDLIKELELDQVSEEQRNAILADFETMLSNRINTEAMLRLPEGVEGDLDLELNKPEPDLMGFYQKVIPGFDLLVAQIVAAFKMEMIELKNTSDEAVAQVTAESNV